MKSNDGLLSNLAWASRFVWESGRALIIATAVLVVVQGILPLAAVYLVKLVIDSVAAGVTGADKTVVFREVVFLIVLSGSVVLLEILCSSVAGLISSAQAQIVTDRMFDILHSKSIEMDLEYY